MKRIFATLAVLLSFFSLGFSQIPFENKEKSAFGPDIQFDLVSYDFGEIALNSDGMVNFTFTNTGTEALILTNVKSSCGCTVPDWPHEPIAPGDKSVIKVKYDTRKVGAFKKSITVSSNVSETPIRLEIQGIVLAPAATD